MNVAAPDWQGRISPVFDVARTLVVAHVNDGTVQSAQRVALDAESLPARVHRLTALGVDVLICGAISRPLETALLQAGVEVYPQTCGEVEQVLAAYAAGRFSQDAYLMPGCCGRRRRRCRNGGGRGRRRARG